MKYLVILILFLAFDYIDVDTKYVNRNIIEFDRKNLNSKYSKKLSNFVRYVYLNLYEKIDKTSYNERWGVEDLEKRLKLKETIPVKLIKKNYSESLYEQNEYEVSNNCNYYCNNFTYFSINIYGLWIT